MVKRFIMIYLSYIDIYESSITIIYFMIQSQKSLS